MNKRKETRTIKTKFGEAKVVTLERDFEANHTPLAVYILFRHGLKHSVPPHLINYRANIAAAKELNVDYIVATSSVGSLNPKIGIGEYVVFDQFIDMTKSRPFTFFQEEGKRFAHTDMTEPYSRIVRAAMIKSLKKNRVRGFHERGTYVCTEGPRFETPAEIRMYRRAGGDVVGMTGVPEVVLAKEIGIEYGSLGIVTNMAAGLQRSISQEEVVKQMNRSLGRTNKILDDTVIEDLVRPSKRAIHLLHNFFLAYTPLQPSGHISDDSKRSIFDSNFLCKDYFGHTCHSYNISTCPSVHSYFCRRLKPRPLGANIGSSFMESSHSIFLKRLDHCSSYNARVRLGHICVSESFAFFLEESEWS